MTTLRIGSAEFELAVRTEAIEKSIAPLRKIETSIGAVAGKLDNMNRAGKRLNRQQTMNLKAFNAQVEAMRKAQKAYSDTIARLQALRAQYQAQNQSTARLDSEIKKIDAAYRRLSNTLQGHDVSLTKTRNSLHTFTTVSSKAATTARVLEKDLKRSGGGAQSFAEKMTNLSKSVQVALGPLSGVAARLTAFSSLASRTTLIIAGLTGIMVAGTVALSKLGKGAFDAALQFEKLNARFLAAAGTIDGAKEKMGFVIKTSRELGLRLGETAEGYSKLSAAAAGTSLEGDKADKIFQSVAKAAAALRLSGQETLGTLRAIEQMMSKGSVQAEELRGQLGERLPGAFQIAARSMGVTTQQLNKMLQEGQVLADDFLPKFAEELEKTFSNRAAENIDSLQGSMNNLANSTNLFFKALAERTNIAEKSSGIFNFLASSIDSVTQSLEHVNKAGGKSPLESLTTVLKTMKSGFMYGNFAVMEGLHILPEGTYEKYAGTLQKMEETTEEKTEAIHKSFEKSFTAIDGIVLAFRDKTSAEFNKTINSAVDKIDKLVNSYEASKKALEQTNLGDIKFQSALGTAENMVAKYSQGQRDEILNVMKQRSTIFSELAQDTDNLTMALARLIVADEHEAKAVLDKIKRYEDVDGVLKDYTKTTEILTRHLENLRAVEALPANLSAEQEKLAKQELERANKLRDLSEQLADINISEEKRNELLAERKQLLEDIDKSQNNINQAQELKKVTRAIDEQLRSLEQQAAAVSMSDKALFIMNQELKLSEEKFIAAGGSANEFAAHLEKVRTASARLYEARKAAEELKKTTKDLERIFDRAFDRIGSAITDAFVRGEKAALDFGDIARGVLSELAQAAIQLSFINPLKNWLFGSMTGYTNAPTMSSLSGLFGGGSGGMGGLGGIGKFFGGLFGGGGGAATYGTSAALAGTGQGIAAAPFMGGSAYTGAAAGGAAAAGAAFNWMPIAAAAMIAKSFVADKKGFAGIVDDLLLPSFDQAMANPKLLLSPLIAGATGLPAPLLNMFGLFDKKPSDKTQAIQLTGAGDIIPSGLQGKKYDPELRTAVDEIGNQLLQVSTLINDLTGASMGSGIYVSIGRRDPSKITGGGETINTATGDAQAAFDAAIGLLLKNLKGGNQSEVAYLQKAFADTGDINAALTNLQKFQAMSEAFHNMTDAILAPNNQLIKQLEALSDSFADLKQQAQEMGMPLDDLASEFAAAKTALTQQAKEFISDFFDQFTTGPTNPLIAQLNLLNDSMKDIRETAEAFGLSLAQVQAGYDASLAALTGNAKEFITGSLSGSVTPQQNPLIAELDALKDRFEEAKKVAAAFGISMSFVGSEFAKAQALLKDNAQQFLDVALNGQDRLTTLLAAFDELMAVAEAFGLSISSVRTGLAESLQDLEMTIVNEIRQLIDSSRQMINFSALESFQKNLVTTNLSPLSPMAQFEAAKDLLLVTQGNALAGDPGAIKEFPSLAQSVLGLGSDVFASGPEYQELFGMVSTTLNELINNQIALEETLLVDIELTLQETSADQIDALQQQTQKLVAELINVRREIQQLRN